jgi:hypothetical protein
MKFSPAVPLRNLHVGGMEACSVSKQKLISGVKLL